MKQNTNISAATNAVTINNESKKATSEDSFFQNFKSMNHNLMVCDTAKRYLQIHGISTETANDNLVGYNPAWKNPDASTDQEAMPVMIFPLSTTSYVATACTEDGAGSKSVVVGPVEVKLSSISKANENDPIFLTHNWWDALAIISNGYKAISLNTENGIVQLKRYVFSEDSPRHFIVVSNERDTQFKNCLIKSLDQLNVSYTEANISRVYSSISDIAVHDHKQFNYCLTLAADEARAKALQRSTDVSSFLEKPNESVPAIIEGLLSYGGLLLVNGAPKSNKSFLMIELALAIASGSKWLGWQCSKESVLLIDVEVDEHVARNRLRAIASAMKIKPENINNYFHLINLRGKAKALPLLTDYIVREAKAVNAKAIIVDPIYPLLTGDENSNSDMRDMSNEFARIAMLAGAAVIYTHHQAKGNSASKKLTDRAAGAGVFTRFPDAFIDISSLVVKGTAAEDYAKSNNATAWRAEVSVRNYAPIPPINLWYSYPLHYIDKESLLDDAPASGTPAGGRALNTKHESPATQKQKILSAFEKTEDSPSHTGYKRLAEVRELSGLSDNTFKKYFKRKFPL